MADRTAYFRDRLPAAIECPHVTVLPLDLEAWALFCAEETLPLVDRVTGWTAIQVGDEVLTDPDPEDPGAKTYEVTIRFCPELMSASTEHLDMSPGAESDLFLWVDPETDPTERAPDGTRDTSTIAFADGYLQIVAHVLLEEVMAAGPDFGLDTHLDVVARATEELHECAAAFLNEIATEMLDRYLGTLA